MRDANRQLKQTGGNLGTMLVLVATLTAAALGDVAPSDADVPSKLASS
jgi:hypothetical protein